MKARIAHVLETINGQSRHRQNEVQLHTLQSQNLKLERSLRDRETEVEKLQEKIGNLESQLQEMTGTDSLTGLPNRQSFKQHLLFSVKRALRLGYSLSLLILDVDQLAEINRSHGSAIGDLVLVKIAQIFRSSVREVDMAARWHDDQLIAVLHETDAEGAAMVAERIRRKVASMDIIDPESKQPIKVNVSLAVAGYLPDSGEASELIENICQALANAKAKGYNRVVIARI